MGPLGGGGGPMFMLAPLDAAGLKFRARSLSRRLAQCSGFEAILGGSGADIRL